MEEKQVLRKIDSLEKLYTLPEVLSEILRITEDDSAPLDSLARIILKDVPMTARILSAANSALYGRHLQVSSVRDAIMTLGARTVKSIALSMSLVNMINRLDTQIDLKSFWKHSLEVAIISELIAEKIESRHKEEAYTAGLIHDVGVLAMDLCFPREYSHVWRGLKNGGHLIKLEEQVFGTNHARVGSYLASKWNLPRTFPATLVSHHDIFDLKEASSDNIVPQIVNLAERIARYQLDIKTELADIEFDNRNIIMKNIGISSNDLADIESDVIPKFLDAANFMEIEVGSPMELLAEANQRIFQLYSEVEDLLNSLKTETNFADNMEFDRMSVEILHTVVATFSHYFNNACASILGRAQLIEMALKKSNLKDHRDILKNSLLAINNGVNSITGTLQELKQVKSFKTTLYHDKTLIIDLEDSLKKYKVPVENSK